MYNLIKYIPKKWMDTWAKITMNVTALENPLKTQIHALDLMNHIHTFIRVQTLVLGISICQMETYCNVSVSQDQPTEGRTVKLLWIQNMEREQWNQTRTKLPADAKKKSPNKLSNNEQCPLPALYVLFRLKTRQQATGEQTDTENVSSIRGKDKSNTGERKQPDWLQTSCPKWKNKRCFVWSRQSNSQRAKQLSLSLEGLRCGYSKHRVTDEFNIMVKGQLNQ